MSAKPSTFLASSSGRATAFIGFAALLNTLTTMDRGLVGLPLRLVLKNGLGLTPFDLSVFMTIAFAPLYVKPLTGFLSDTFPIFGSRRKAYLLIGSILASAGWLLLPLVPLRYGVLLAAMLGICLMATLVKSTTGAVLVEEGQATGATGKLTSVHSIFGNAANLVGSAVGGYFVSRAFGWTCGVAAGATILLIPVILTLVEESPQSSAKKLRKSDDLRKQWNAIRQARPLWIAILILVCIDLAPGLSTPLLYLQTDVNHFSGVFLGWLGAVTGTVMIAAGFLYLALCKRFTMRSLLIGIIVLNALAPLGYLHYHTHYHALIVDSVYMLAYEMGTIALLDLAARTIPKGSEGFAFGLLWSAMLVAANGSDLLGSYIYGTLQLPFSILVGLNSGTTLLTLLLVPLLPAALLGSREQDATMETTDIAPELVG